MSLMTFVLNTLQPRVNDPTNARLWLPKLLAGMTDSNGQPVLPINASDQNIGAITGDNGAQVANNFASTYAAYESAQGQDIVAKPDPNNPYPLLEFPTIQIQGLQNIFVTIASATPTASGYDVVLNLIFSTYPDPTNGIAMQPLSLIGTYKITQALLWQVYGGTDWTSLPLVGSGDISIAFTSCQLIANASVTITGEGANRANNINVSSLQLVGTGPGTDPLPVVVVNKLTIDAYLNNANAGLVGIIESALQGSAGPLTQAVDTLLNSQSNLGSVNNLVGGRASGVLDGILGPIPSSGLPTDSANQHALTPVDLYLFDRIRLSLVNPSSQWFLPIQLASSSDPVIEPYTNASINVPDQTIKGLQYTNITLTGVTLSGGSNAAMPVAATTVDLGTISSTVTLGILPEGEPHQVPRSGGPVTMPVPPAPPINFTASFSLVQQGFKPVPLQGTLTAQISGVPVDLTVALSGTSVTDLTVGLSHVSTSLTGATIDVSVLLDPPNDGLQQIMDALFGQAAVQQQVLDAINTALASQSKDISNQLSQIARTAILNQLQ